jgi:hypothetical protein
MAHPFAPCPTLDEFIACVSSDFDVQLQTVELIGPKGRENVFYLIREEEGRKLIASLPSLEKSDRLVPSQLRSLGAALQIPGDQFGLTVEMIADDSDADAEDETLH